MKKNIWSLCGFLISSAVLLSPGSSIAQNRPRGTAILSEMPRQEVNGRYYTSRFPVDIAIGREVFEAFARLGSNGLDFGQS